ncbi:hypothetical protein BXZ70DRAFT_929798 [Cristinia sonorae]|uniref:Uncharacterized protein n=1 Tax=Cristinia sonorae TaxID=1940300 RepID=A0A8K0USC1_9AGAR|nr:hypothetical protein BXZ70DRAFT_929798 [Cristinia sonorae]
MAGVGVLDGVGVEREEAPRIPPTLPPIHNEPGLQTPSQEWASKTTTALRDPDTTNTAADTPANMKPLPPARTVSADPNVPGAFHADDEQDPLAGTVDTVKGTFASAATSMGETAKQYLPQAAQYLPKSVVDTMQSYLPQSQSEITRASMNDVPHRKSLPSTEFTGASAGEYVGGVGSLPGHVGESGVARLPDEVPTPHNESATTGIGGAVDAVKQKVLGVTPTPGTSLPSTETQGAKPGDYTAGVGALPGKLGEQGVARLPDEVPAREKEAAATTTIGGAVDTVKQKGTSSLLSFICPAHLVLPVLGSTSSPQTSLPSSEPHGALPGTRSAGVGSLPGHADESGVARLPDEHINVTSSRQAGDSHAPAHDRDSAATATGASVGIAGVGLGYPGPNIGKNVGLPDDKNTGVGAGGDLGSSTRALSPESQYSQPSFQGHEPSTKATGGVGSSGAATGSMLAAGGFGGVVHDSNVGGAQKETQTTHGAATPNREDEKHTSEKKVNFGDKKEDSGDKSKNFHKGAENKGEGYDTDYHPAQLHPKPSTPSHQTDPSAPDHQKLASTTTGVTDTSRKEGVSEKAQESSPSHSKEPSATSTSSSSGGGKKKVGFMEKMKGEAKVLLGHLEGGKKGEEKVEEGKRIKTGGAAAGAKVEDKAQVKA